ncbi:MAG: hypothetical protein NVS3B27_00150 [Novosphingobium sp.]
MDLQVGPVEIGARLQEGAGLQPVLPPGALARQQILQPGLELTQPLDIIVDRDRLGAGPVERNVEMVLQVGAHALAIEHRRDAVRGQHLGIADARKLEDLR